MHNYQGKAFANLIDFNKLIEDMDFLDALECEDLSVNTLTAKSLKKILLSNTRLCSAAERYLKINCHDRQDLIDAINLVKILE